MKMKPKMLLGTTAISLGAVILTTAGLVSVASNLSTESLQAELKDRLILQRDVQKDQITTYLNSVTSEVTESASLDGIFSKALIDFSAPFSSFKGQVPDSGTKYKKSVTNFYTEQFSKRFIEKNTNVSPIAVSDIMGKLDSNAVALQNYYISTNPNPSGEKDKLVKVSGINADYDKVHAKYHTRFRDYLNKWGFYDVFLVDAKSGNIVYSVFKELDFATSLKTGPYANSGLGTAFKQAISGNMQGQSYSSKMAAYYPSYNAFAAFVSSPLYVGGELKGALVIQMPLDKINQVMTFDKRWKDYGLGESGETYLVASDYTMRNDSRGFAENSEGFIEVIKATNVSLEVVSNIAKQGTTIGLIPVRSPGSEAALAGETGFAIFPDYRDVSVLSAYAPLNIAGLNWAILAEIDEAEAFAPVEELVNDIIQMAVFIGLALVVVSLLFSLFFVNGLVKPILFFSDIMTRFRAGENDLRVKSEADDEIGELATEFDALLDEREATLATITKENDELNDSVIEMLQVAAQQGQGNLTLRMTVAEDVTGPLADSLNLVMEKTEGTLVEVKQTAGEVDMSAKIVQQQSDNVVSASKQESEIVTNTVQELAEAAKELQRIAELAQQCNTAADESVEITDKAQKTVMASVEGINSIRDNISETEKRIKRLGERSQEIAGVTDIINGIAEKTHVLSLNASMQAASAGEAGRGFAVVATEIQRLAESATEATTEIGALIKNIQIDTADTVTTMNKAITQVVEGTKMAESAGAQMHQTRTKSLELVKLVQEIATSSQNQVEVSNKLQVQAEGIQKSNTETATQLEQQAIQTEGLVEYAADLVKSISAFKLSA